MRPSPAPAGARGLAAGIRTKQLATRSSLESSDSATQVLMTRRLEAEGKRRRRSGAGREGRGSSGRCEEGTVQREERRSRCAAARESATGACRRRRRPGDGDPWVSVVVGDDSHRLELGQSRPSFLVFVAWITPRT